MADSTQSCSQVRELFQRRGDRLHKTTDLVDVRFQLPPNIVEAI